MSKKHSARNRVVGTLLVVLVVLSPTVSSVGSSSAAPPLQTTESLVGEYLFNEGSGDIIQDSSGQGYHGTVHGAQWVTSPIPDSDSQPSYALRFNKTYAQVPSNVLKNLPLSISLWVKPDENVNDERNNIISNDRPAHSGHGIGINRNGYVYVEYEGRYGWFRNTQFQVQWGQWYHIVVVYESGRIRTYVNAELVDDLTYEQVALDAEDRFLIGRHNFDSRLGDRVFFNGVVDTIRIYHKALTPDEITELYGWECEPQTYQGVQHCTADNGNTHVIFADLDYVQVQMMLAEGYDGDENPEEDEPHECRDVNRPNCTWGGARLHGFEWRLLSL